MERNSQCLRFLYRDRVTKRRQDVKLLMLVECGQGCSDLPNI